MKHKSWRWFSLIVVLSMLFSATSVFAAEPAPQVEFKAETPTVAWTGSRDNPALYIVRLVDAPVASYDGGIPGLDAVKGEGKLDVDSPEAAAYAGYLDQKQAEILGAMERTFGRAIEVVYTYKYATNGMTVKLSAEEAQKLASFEGVEAVNPEFKRFIDTDTTPAWLNVPGIWDGTATGGLPGTMGEGIIAGIIDTGINMDSRSFADVGDDGYDHTNPWGAGTYAGWCDPTDPNYDPMLVCNDKLIGAYSYPTANMDPEDDDSHGSHTASTTAGNVLYDVDYNGYTFEQISGMAPHANIIAYDVCITNAGCSGAAILAAIDDAIDNGVDVINYSIGGGPGSPWGADDDLAFLAARDAGVFVATSAGNDGPGPGTVGSPANSPWMTSVGNGTTPRVVANTFDVTGPGAVPGDLIGLSAVVGTGPAVVADIEAPLVYAGDIDPANWEGCAAFPAGSFTDAIALIQRGSCGFADKINNAANAGAVAVVVFNHSAGPPMVMGGCEGTTIPGVFLTLTDGAAVRDWIQAETDPTGRINNTFGFVYNEDWGMLINSGSSRGPNFIADIIKPDILAPGTNVFAAYMGGPDDFGMMSGTSMASPHVAGFAALLMALHPDWTPAEVQSALMMTSINPGILKEDGVTPADPFDLGAGKLDGANPAQAGLVLNETTANYEDADPAIGGDPATLNLASLAQDQCLATCTWEREVRSTLDFPVTYTLSADVPPSVTVGFDPAEFTIGPGETQVIEITADVTGAPMGGWLFGTVELNTDDMFPEVAVQADTLTEGFEGDFPPAGWNTYALSASVNWFQTSTRAHSGAYSAFHNDVSGAQDGWLVTPQITPDTAADLIFWQSDNYATLGYYEYHGIWVSTGSGDPNDGEFVELVDLGPALEDEWEEITVDLDAYAGAPIYLAFRYTGDFEDEWYVDDVEIGPLAVAGTCVPNLHMPMAVMPTGGVLPDFVEITTRRSAGSELIEGIQASEITDLTIDAYGLVIPDKHETALGVIHDFSDFPNIYYDNLDVAMVIDVPVPADAMRVVAEVLDTTSPDVDMLLAYDANGNGPDLADTTLHDYCQSATGGPWEYCSFEMPDAGDWYVIVINFAESTPGTPDPVMVGAAVVTGDEGNMMFDGPTAVPGGNPFDIALYFDLPEMMAGDRAYGIFALGTDPASPGDIGMVPVDIIRVEDDVMKEVSSPLAMAGDTLTYTITVLDNVRNFHLGYTLTDTVPAGFTLVPGSADASMGTVVEDGNQIIWTGVMQSPVGAEGSYNITTSLDDPLCDTGFGGYVDLSVFGIYAQAGIVGDTTVWTAFSGNPINFYGEEYPVVGFTDDGFAIFDPDNNYFGFPWTPQSLPNPDGPNNVLAPLWQDMEIFYTAPPTNTGVSLATAGPDVFIIEYDDAQFYGGSADAWDFEIVGYRAVDDTPGAYEYVFAYNNLNGDLTGPITIGAENMAGDGASVFLNADDASTVLSDGLMICFDYTGPSFDPATITYQVTVDMGVEPGVYLNEVMHITDNPGDMHGMAQAEVWVLPEEGADMSDLAGYAVAAHHGPHSIWLGSAVDEEWTPGSDPAPEDNGVSREATEHWTPGANVTLYVDMGATVTTDGWLGGWIDWNADGMFDMSEKVIDAQVNSGANSFTIAVPMTYVMGDPLNARFRLFEDPDELPGFMAEPAGLAPDGEVEDYIWTFGPTAVAVEGFAARATAPALVLAAALTVVGVLVIRRKR